MVLDDALPIALVGLSGAGKSTVAPLIAARLGISAIDLDAAVEEAGGASVAALFVAEGEAAFRDREEKALERALQRGPCVIACGGGLVSPRADEVYGALFGGERIFFGQYNGATPG